MKYKSLLLLTALATASSQAAVTVTDNGLTAPTLGVNDTGYIGAPNARFGWGDGVNETVGQTFTLASPITLGSIWISYNDFDAGTVTLTLTVDAGNNGSNEITETGVVLDNSNFSGSSDDGGASPYYWMQFDLSSHNLVLPSGVSKFSIVATAATSGGSDSWPLGSMYNNTDVYAGGSEQGLPNGGDFLFAVTEVPEPSSSLLLALGTGALAWRRRRC
ncbi:MAG: PEP-CTERM sorting domain-containing protein [Akkermansiaceae bacterium]|nr:PEP-CTERM sorting domain-containing protein [Akkermansiaceae bacterium]